MQVDKYNYTCMKLKNLIVVLPIILASILVSEVNAQVKQNRLRNTLTGADSCLDIIEDGKNNRLTMTKCANIAGQRWSMTATEKDPQAYRLQTPFTGTDKCLNIINDGENNKVTMAKCSNLPGQLWTVTPSKTISGNSGYYFVTNALTGASNCLNVLNDGRNNQLTMAKCDNISGQSWKITSTR
jgi:Ricin-type beta-trefoil lectin domain